MDLKDYRERIDSIDDQLVKLFQQRMEVASEIAQYKKERGMPILDAGRERAKLNDVCSKVCPEMRNYTSVLYSSIFELSRSYQSQVMARYNELSERIRQAVETTPKLFPRNATVAVCGVEGAYAQIATEKMVQMARMAPTARMSTSTCPAALWSTMPRRASSFATCPTTARW